MKKVFWVEFINDRSVLVNEGQSLLEASLGAGIPHYHDCGGHGRCTTCRVMVQSGSSSLTPYSSREQVLRRRINSMPENVRLACQTRVIGNGVKVLRMIRDEADLQMYITEGIADDINNSGNERELALLFLDIRDFTPFMESYLPFDVIHIMRRLFAIYKSCITKHNGKIIETAGDGFYAVFGLDSEIDDAVRDGYSAGKAILSEMEKFNEQYLQKHFYHSFKVGIGLHAGRVIIGNIGIGVNDNLTVMGMPVNIASRIQAATKEVNNSFLVSDTAMNYLDGVKAKRAVIKPKGVRTAISVYLCGEPYSQPVVTNTVS